MAKFRSKPIVIEAVQFDDIPAHDPPGVFRRPEDDTPYVVTIHDDRAFLTAGDWIIPEPDGVHHYPCKPDIFEQRYEPEDESKPRGMCAEAIIKVLGWLYTMDDRAADGLVRARVPVNERVVVDPHLMVNDDNEIGILGVLNGILSVLDEDFRIAIICEQQGEQGVVLLGFELLELPAGTEDAGDAKPVDAQ